MVFGSDRQQFAPVLATSMNSMKELCVPIDIRQLRYAIAAADHGSFYRAARVLEIEQSTLSRAILKLERSIGMPIFQRSRAGVTMTLAGNAFIRGAKPMVATADKLVAMMRAAGQGRAGGLMLGHNSSVSAGNLRATLISWRDVHPNVGLDAHSCNLLPRCQISVVAEPGSERPCAG